MPFFKPNVKKLLAQKDVDRLIEALQYKKNTKVRCDAADALGQLQSPKSIKPLIDALTAEDKEVVAHCKEALVKLQEISYDSLVEALDSQDRNLLTKILLMLYEFGSKRAIKAICEVFQNTNDNSILSLITAIFNELVKKDTLDDLADREVVVSLLIKKLHDKTLEHQTKFDIVATLDKLDSQKVLEPLINLLDELASDKTVDIRAKVEMAKKLGRSGDRRAVKPLINLLNALTDKTFYPDNNDMSGKMRYASHINDIANALAELNDQRAVEVFIHLLEVGQSSHNGMIVEAAVARLMKCTGNQEFNRNASYWRSWWTRQK